MKERNDSWVATVLLAINDREEATLLKVLESSSEDLDDLKCSGEDYLDEFPEIITEVYFSGFSIGVWKMDIFEEPIEDGDDSNISFDNEELLWDPMCDEHLVLGGYFKPGRQV